MIMTKQFIRSLSPFVYNLLFNQRRTNENEIIHWYLLIDNELGNDDILILWNRRGDAEDAKRRALCDGFNVFERELEAEQ